MTPLPQSILFCCDHNAVRSPMAEGLMKKFYGTDVYVQSAGVMSDMEIDGFAIAVCQELDVELSRHRVRSFDEMAEQGDELDSFDLIVAFTPASHARAQELTAKMAVQVEHWPVAEPRATGDSRDAKLTAYRDVRDEIATQLQARFS